jgi:outer membrane protein OmpA-like peptidoglycan-associated protein
MKLVKFTLSFLAGGVILAALILVVSIFMMPVAVKWYANNWFASHELHSNIESVEFDMTDGLLMLDGLSVKDSEGTHLKIDHLLVQIKLLDLLERKILIQNVELAGLYVDVVKRKDNVMKYAGVVSQKTNKALPADTNSDSSVPWTILLEKVELKDIEACYLEPALQNMAAYHACTKIDNLEWQGKSKYTLYKDSELRSGSLIISSALKVSGFSLDDLRLKRTVMRFDEMDINNLKTVGVGDIQIHSIILDDYQAFQSSLVNDDIGIQPYLVSLDRIRLDNVKTTNLSNIAIESMLIDGVQARLSRATDGSINIQKIIGEFSLPNNKEAPAKVKPAEESASISLSLKHLAIDGKSVIDVQDASVAPLFSNRLSNITLKLDGVDTSDKKKISQMQLGFTVGSHGSVQAKGNVQLLAKRPTVSLNAKIVGVDIAKFNVYANELLQQQVKSGHLDADLHISIKKGVIDAKSKITLHKFYIEALGAEQASQYKETIGMPLNSALSLLREKDDRITLKIPVTGDIENPEFSFNDVFRKVSADAIKAAVINYYTPFGLVKLLAAGYKLATALRFEPVSFEPAQSGLDEKGKQQLDKLAKLLNQRPKIRLVICGQVVRKDFESLYPSQAKKLEKAEREKKAEQSVASDMVRSEVPSSITMKQKNKLIDLAILRGKMVQQYLVEQHGVDPNRLILCNPTFSYADRGDARVEISI